MLHGTFYASLLILSILSQCAAQMPSPLQGTGIEPSEPTRVFVSCYLDKLLKVDDNQYGFEAVIYVHMTWVDKRAVAAVFERTEQLAKGGGAACRLPCEDPPLTCCDTVWRPTFTITNMESYPQDRVDYSTLGALGPSPDLPLFANDTQAVLKWIVRFNGRFYCSMSFWRFPFDKQALFVTAWQQSSLGARAVSVEASSTGTELRGTSTGPFDVPGTDLPAWKVESVAVVPYNADFKRLLSSASPFNPKEPNITLEETLGRGSWNSSATGPWSSFVVKIIVRRLWRFHFFSFFLPVILCVVLSWASFVVSPRNIETRLTVTVSLFLSLTALEFVLSENVPQSSCITKLGWLVIASYLFLFLAVVETLIVYSVYR